MANREIPPERQALNVFGQALGVVGLLMFLSVFASAAMHFGDFTNFNEQARSMGLRAFGGIACMIAGGALVTVARRGVAGSGIVLDPERARKDLEPWARMGGGVIKDALDETGIELGGAKLKETPVDFTELIRKLHELYKDGIITEEEFLREKEEILERN